MSRSATDSMLCQWLRCMVVTSRSHPKDLAAPPERMRNVMSQASKFENGLVASLSVVSTGLDLCNLPCIEASQTLSRTMVDFNMSSRSYIPVKY